MEAGGSSGGGGGGSGGNEAKNATGERSDSEADAALWPPNVADPSMRGFQRALRDAPDGVVIVNAQGLVVFSNPALDGMLGYSDGSLAGRDLSVLLPPEARGRHAGHLRGFFTRTSPRPSAAMARPLRVRALCADGSLLPIHVVLASRGHPLGPALAIAYVRDVSEMVAAQEDAQRARAAVETMLRGTTHDVRTALNAIVAARDIFQQHEEHVASVPECAEAIEFLEAGTTHAQAVVGRVLDLLQLQAGKAEFQDRPFVLAHLLERVELLNRAACQKRGVSFVSTAEGEAKALECPLLGDPDRLSRVLQNLAHNAAKFSSPGGRIGVFVADLDHAGPRTRFEVHVCDTGCGIPQEKLGRIFEPFEQAAEDVAQRAQGTGLGLTIARDMVRGMGGTLEVRSDPSGGALSVPASSDEQWTTVFTIRLSLPPAPHDRAVPRRRRRPSSPAFLTSERRPRTPDSAPASPPPPTSLEPPPPPRGEASPTSSKKQRHLAARSPLPSGGPGAGDAALHSDSEGRDPRRVLVADDNSINQRILCAQLKKLGLQSDVASNGREAVRMALENRYAAVLMDYTMPVLSGPEAASELRSQGSTVPILAVTALATPDASEHCTAAGMDGFVVKPVRRSSLRRALRPWVELETAPAS